MSEGSQNELDSKQELINHIVNNPVARVEDRSLLGRLGKHHIAAAMVCTVLLFGAFGYSIASSTPQVASPSTPDLNTVACSSTPRLQYGVGPNFSNRQFHEVPPVLATHGDDTVYILGLNEEENLFAIAEAPRFLYDGRVDSLIRWLIPNPTPVPAVELANGSLEHLGDDSAVDTYVQTGKDTTVNFELNFTSDNVITAECSVSRG
jgi:hypothetical protein